MKQESKWIEKGIEDLADWIRKDDDDDEQAVNDSKCVVDHPYS